MEQYNIESYKFTEHFALRAKERFQVEENELKSWIQTNRIMIKDKESNSEGCIVVTNGDGLFMAIDPKNKKLRTCYKGANYKKVLKVEIESYEKAKKILIEAKQRTLIAVFKEMKENVSVLSNIEIFFTEEYSQLAKALAQDDGSFNDIYSYFNDNFKALQKIIKILNKKNDHFEQLIKEIDEVIKPLKIEYDVYDLQVCNLKEDELKVKEEEVFYEPFICNDFDFLWKKEILSPLAKSKNISSVNKLKFSLLKERYWQKIIQQLSGLPVDKKIKEKIKSCKKETIENVEQILFNAYSDKLINLADYSSIMEFVFVAFAVSELLVRKEYQLPNKKEKEAFNSFLKVNLKPYLSSKAITEVQKLYNELPWEGFISNVIDIKGVGKGSRDKLLKFGAS